MPNTIGSHTIATFTSPVNGTTPIDANTVRGNDNTIQTAYNGHDSDPGIHLQSSLLVARPTAGTAGRKWMTTDPGAVRLFHDTGSSWEEVAYALASGGTILLANGTAAAPSLAATADTNTGLFFPATDSLAVSLNGTEALRFTLGPGTTRSMVLGGTNSDPYSSNARSFTVSNASFGGASAINIASSNDYGSSQLSFGTQSTQVARLETNYAASSFEIRVNAGSGLSNGWGIGLSGLPGHLVPLNTNQDIGTTSVAVRVGYFETLQGSGSPWNILTLRASTSTLYGRMSLNGESNGYVIIGAATARRATKAGVRPNFFYEGLSTEDSTFALYRNAANAFGAVLQLGKSRGATYGGTTIVQAGDELGMIEWTGANGSTGINSGLAAAYIRVISEGTPSSTSMGARLSFGTTADGASAVTERWRISNVGHLLAATDASFDIGASGATRPRDLYLGRNMVGGGWVRAGAASAGEASTTTIGSTTSTTVGAAGGASALPATPLGYIIAHVGTTEVRIPYYNA